ncbi:unnamed protein product, partial [Hapterophycus canaliculatus]
MNISLSPGQVLRLVLDPDMLLQLAKKSSENRQVPPSPPHSHVDAWKSINGRPFARWIDPFVDV